MAVGIGEQDPAYLRIGVRALRKEGVIREDGSIDWKLAKNKYEDLFGKSADNDTWFTEYWNVVTSSTMSALPFAQEINLKKLYNEKVQQAKDQRDRKRGFSGTSGGW